MENILLFIDGYIINNGTGDLHIPVVWSEDKNIRGKNGLAVSCGTGIFVGLQEGAFRKHDKG
jgi:hypothetical protein